MSLRKLIRALWKWKIRNYGLCLCQESPKEEEHMYKRISGGIELNSMFKWDSWKGGKLRKSKGYVRKGVRKCDELEEHLRVYQIEEIRGNYGGWCQRILLMVLMCNHGSWVKIKYQGNDHLWWISLGEGFGIQKNIWILGSLKENWCNDVSGIEIGKKAYNFLIVCGWVMSEEAMGDII